MLLLMILALVASAVVSLSLGNFAVALFCGAWAIVLPLIEWHLGLPPHDVTIGHNYLYRWFVIPHNRFLNVYLHKFVGSDDDRALHDHPWWNCSVILAGSYREHLPGGVSRIRNTFDIVCRPAHFTHRVEILTGTVWTLFITGPKVREWGFWCPKGWVHWTKFCDPADPYGKIGKGCSQ